MLEGKISASTNFSWFVGLPVSVVPNPLVCKNKLTFRFAQRCFERLVFDQKKWKEFVYVFTMHLVPAGKLSPGSGKQIGETAEVMSAGLSSWK